LLAVLKSPAYHFKRIGLEAGPLSQWLYSAFAEAELTVICVETRDHHFLTHESLSTSRLDSVQQALQPAGGPWGRNLRG
jgi:hypothetical protein